MARDSSTGMMMMMMLVIMVACSFSFSASAAGGVLLLKPDLLKQMMSNLQMGISTTGGSVTGTDTTTPEGVSISSSYGGGGGSAPYTAKCTGDKIVKQILVTEAVVGTLPNRHGRVADIGILCTDDKKVWGKMPGKTQDATSLSCDSKGMSGVQLWTTGVVQKVWPTCVNGNEPTAKKGGKIVDAGDGGSTGDKIGTVNTYNCPSGKKLVGISGIYGSHVDSIKFHCK